MKVITFTSRKGGTNKSTLTLNSAGRKGLKHKTLLIDIDEQCNATSVVKTSNDSPTIYDVLSGRVGVGEAIQPSIFKNVDYISGSKKINDIRVDRLTLKKLFQSIFNQYDYVFIDTPPGISTVVQSAYVSSDLILIPTILDKFSSANLMTVINEVRGLNPKASIKVIPTSVISNSKLHKQVLKQLTEFINTQEDVELTHSLPNSIEVSNQMMENKLLANSNKVNKLKSAMKKLIDKEM